MDGVVKLREKRTAAELRAMVQARLNALPDVVAIKARLPLAGPIAGVVVATGADAEGCNWDLCHLYQGAVYFEEFRDIVNELRTLYVLAE